MSAFKNKNINYKLLEAFPGRDLLIALFKKYFRGLKYKFGFSKKKDFGYERAVNYNGLVVFDRPEFHGEGITIGQDYVRALLELGFKRCENIFEFCSGPGYIGYSLLAQGFCEKLTLADINPLALEMTRKTAKYNNIEHLVNIYESDVFDNIPETEKWDLVVSNPPHFPLEMKMGNTEEGEVNLKAYDEGWELHKKFYRDLKKHIKPGGHVVIQENTQGGMDLETFRPMIEENGGKIIDWVQSKDVTGKTNPMYYLVSQW